MSNKNKNLNQAKINKKDEFYTQLSDIENELKHYKEHFKNKVVFCNCDDPEYSNFFFFFKEQFQNYGLKKLITTHYMKDYTSSYKIEITYKNNKIQEQNILLKENGDFRSNECVELLKESDIVVTNPPFSLFKEFVEQLFSYNKKFLIIGPISAITRPNVFEKIKNNQMWLGYGFKSGLSKFIDCNNKNLNSNLIKEMIDKKQNLKSFGNIHWYTNLEHNKRYEELILYETYTPEKYPKYYNYDAINVNKYSLIPKDYDKLIGVPITFLNWFNPNQFEIIGLSIPNSINFLNKKLQLIKDGKPTGKFIKTNNILYVPYNNKKDSPIYQDESKNLWQSSFKRLIIKKIKKDAFK